eukprot:TRINITY_DN27315_c0_g1_i1.p1 TRINITY_DN27315_c0_g1~~TRINITY_DN27315_c0_g1_i1.p1  ORF type:complete len:724 (-),score=114.15 TRINITY_DN27315_c0_g1_i1:31-2175(-)
MARPLCAAVIVARRCSSGAATATCGSSSSASAKSAQLAKDIALLSQTIRAARPAGESAVKTLPRCAPSTASSSSSCSSSKVAAGPTTSAASDLERLRHLSGQLAALPVEEVRADDLSAALHACGRARLAITSIASPASNDVAAVAAAGSRDLQECADDDWVSLVWRLAARLRELDGSGLAAAARAFASSRAADSSILECLQRRTVELATTRCSAAKSGAEDTLGSRDAVAIVSVLGSLAPNLRVRDEQLPRDERSQSLSMRPARQALDAHLASFASELSIRDIAFSIQNLLKLGKGRLEIVPASRPFILDRAAAVIASEDSVLDPIDAVRLVASYAKLGFRDAEVLQMVAQALAAGCERGTLIPPAYIPSLVLSMVTQLGPPPDALKSILETSLPAAVASFRIPELVLVVPALAFIPGLRARRRGLGHAVFGACLAAPLSALRPRAIVDVLRSAQVMEYIDAEFWVVAFREVENSIESGFSANVPWAADNLAATALIAGRTMASGRGRPSVGEVREADWNGDADASQVPLQTAVPAAARVLRVAANAAGGLIHDFTPRDLGILAIALSKADLEDGHLFALLSHRALELFGSGERFGARDVSQLLAALVAFGYQDELLLEALWDCANANLQSYDERARDIILSSFAALGTPPLRSSLPHRSSALAEALLEFELKRGKASDRAMEHLGSVEVCPVDGLHEAEVAVGRRPSAVDSMS